MREEVCRNEGKEIVEIEKRKVDIFKIDDIIIRIKKKMNGESIKDEIVEKSNIRNKKSIEVKIIEGKDGKGLENRKELRIFIKIRKERKNMLRKVERKNGGSKLRN